MLLGMCSPRHRLGHALPAAEEADLTPREIVALPKFLRARWLYCRVQGMAKIAPEKRLRFLLNGIRESLEWLDQHEACLVEAISALREG